MMRRVIVFLFLLQCLVICNSCKNKSDKQVFQRLSQWDNMVDSFPERISDSLKIINPDNLNRADKAYYGLLKVISDDKNYVNFTSDSLINAVSDYYRHADPNNRNYIRALAYQGIIRTRIGVKDSTAYEPLKEAGKYFALMETPDLSLGYLINYFLGNINFSNRNYILAHDYYIHALNYSHQEPDSTHMFDAYLSLYWNEMIQEKLDKGLLYLDTLSSFYQRLPKKDYFIINAQSVYYDVTDKPEKALEKEKELLNLSDDQHNNIVISRLYYNISSRFVGLQQLDSAMLYARMAIDFIEDSTYRQNYLYYQNVANIAEKQEDYLVANDYRKQASELYKNSVRERLDMQIEELEKRYDLSEAENKVLRAYQQNLLIIIGALVLLIILIFILMYAWKIKRRAKIKLMQVEYKMQQQDLQARILREEAGKRKWLLQLYGHISGRLASLQEEIATLTQRYIYTQPNVYREMEKILRNTDTELKDIAKTLASDDETFHAYTQLTDAEGIFNTTEKMMLMLLACNADNRQLATFMNTSQESIRVRKSQLKRKMQEKNMDTTLFHE